MHNSLARPCRSYVNDDQKIFHWNNMQVWCPADLADVIMGFSRSSSFPLGLGKDAAWLGVCTNFKGLKGGGSAQRFACLLANETPSSSSIATLAFLRLIR
jgi:hypothetical protein